MFIAFGGGGISYVFFNVHHLILWYIPKLKKTKVDIHSILTKIDMKLPPGPQDAKPRPRHHQDDMKHVLGVGIPT